jgi:hypothetical protein
MTSAVSAAVGAVEAVAEEIFDEGAAEGGKVLDPTRDTLLLLSLTTASARL